jgi:uncharacterized repeat protein (TIGR01451 family)
MNIQFAKVRKLSSLGRYYFLAALLIAGAFLSGLPNATPVNAAIGSVTHYPLPTTGSLSNIGLGPDGNIWYTTYGPATTTRVGKVTSSGAFTEYLNRTPNSRYPASITTGSDGNVWYAELGPNNESRIVKISPSGTVLNMYEVANNYRSESLVLGPGGDIWFASGGKIGRISTSGVIDLYTIGTGSISAVTPGPDGNIWYTYSTGIGNRFIGKMTPLGIFANYSLPSAYGYARDITTGPDGNLWVTLPGKQFLLKVTTAGVMTQHAVATGSYPNVITAASDGNLWYVTNQSGKVGRMTPAGAFTEFSVSGLSVNTTMNIVSGADNAVWIYDSNQNRLTRVAIELTSQITTFTSAAPTNAVIGGQTYTPTASASSGLPVVITVDSSSSAVCSIDGSGVVSFQGAGTCIVNADQAGDADYKPAPRVQQSFNVLPVDAESSVALNCPSNALVGDTVSCSITVLNNGPAASENTSLTALFPSSFTNASLSGGGTLSGQHITWTIPSLASNDTAILTLTATLSAPGKQRISAALLQTSPDPSSLNNIVAETITVN